MISVFDQLTSDQLFDNFEVYSKFKWDKTYFRKEKSSKREDYDELWMNGDYYIRKQLDFDSPQQIDIKDEKNRDHKRVKMDKKSNKMSFRDFFSKKLRNKSKKSKNQKNQNYLSRINRTNKMMTNKQSLIIDIGSNKHIFKNSSILDLQNLQNNKRSLTSRNHMQSAILYKGSTEKMKTCRSGKEIWRRDSSNLQINRNSFEFIVQKPKKKAPIQQKLINFSKKSNNPKNAKSKSRKRVSKKVRKQSLDSKRTAREILAKKWKKAKSKSPKYKKTVMEFQNFKPQKSGFFNVGIDTSSKTYEANKISIIKIDKNDLLERQRSLSKKGTNNSKNCQKENIKNTNNINVMSTRATQRHFQKILNKKSQGRSSRVKLKIKSRKECLALSKVKNYLKD